MSFLRTVGIFGAVRDIFGALFNGAALYPLNVKEEGVAHMADWLVREEITVLFSGASLFRHFVYTLTEEEAFPRLRLIRLGSESVRKRDVELYKKHFSPDCILVNGLSSSETGTVRKCFINEATCITTGSVPVGYPLDDMDVLLLDDAGNEVGFNHVGEIAIKSNYLSLGYWRRPELTRARFLAGLSAEDERIYFTGDLGRMSPDGCLIHMGRKDLQVKIRGYRVEVVEIEEALGSLDMFREVVVVAREDHLDSQRLVAYLVPNGQPPPGVTTLRRLLAETLPDYMIPSAFVFLDALPLNPNGKVDRQALRPPGTARPNLDNPFVPSRTPVEERLLEIWAEVLNLDGVGIHDNFLELGGNSLLATRVISRVLKTFRVELPLRSLLDTLTVANMAVVITQSRAEKVEQEDLDRMLAELEAFSDEEAKQLLANERAST